MQHWLDKVLTLLQAETSNLRELAHMAGADPKTFYRGANLDGVDISGQDVTGMEFTNFSTSSTTADTATRVDARYIPRFDLFEDDWTQYSTLKLGNEYSLFQADDFLQQGNQLSSRGQHELAVANYLIATRHFPLDSRFWLRLGHSLAENKDLPKAIRILYDTVQKFPHVERARIQLATLFQKRGDTLEAANILKEATQVFPASPLLWTSLVSILSEIDINEAISSQRILLALYPHDPRNWQRLASLQLDAGDTRGAVASYRKIISKSSEYAPGLAQEMTTALHRHHRYKQAVTLLKEVIDRHPSQMDAYRCLADTNSRRGDFDESFYILEAAVRQFPTSPLPLKWLGDLSRKNGDTKASLQAYRRAVKLKSADPAPWKWLGRELERQRQFAKAAETYQRAIEATSDVAPSKWLSDLLERTGKPSDAISVLYSARDRHLNNPVVWAWLIEALDRTGDPVTKKVRRDAMKRFGNNKRLPKVSPDKSTSKLIRKPTRQA